MEIDLQNIDTENVEFQNIQKLIRFTNRSIFMTGRAGTGKSTFLKHICANTNKRHVILAPTGIAAVNAGGVTLHSFFKIPFKPLMPDDPEFRTDRLRKRLKYSKEHAKLIKELELIVIDEISMVRADLIDFVDKVLRVYSGNMRQPFGGKQMLLVGDIFQLEPVVTSDMRDILRQLYPNPYFFSAFAFRNFEVVPIELRKVYRQQDDQFVGMLDRLRIGAPTREDVSLLNARVIADNNLAATSGEDFTMTLATRRDMVDRINDDHLAKLKAPEIVYKGSIVDNFPENSLPTSLELTLKTGAQIVFVRNDRDKRWVNGTVAKVYSATPDKLEIELENGNRHVVEKEQWDNITYKYDEANKKVIETVLGSFIQYPVRLAWALTIHKSQGLTFNNVIIDVGRGAFSGGQTYVALSRSTSLNGIKLRSSVNERDIFVNPAIVQFSRQFNNQQVVDAAIATAAADEAYARAAKAFDNGEYASAVEAFLEAVATRSELGRPSIARLMRQKMNSLSLLTSRISELEERIENDRQKFEALADEYVAMGIDCLEEIGDFTSALANFDKALSLSPGHNDALIQKSKTYILAGQPDDAIDLLNTLLKVNPKYLDALYLLSDAWLALDDEHNALDSLLRALSANKRCHTTHLKLANFYERIGDEDSAEEHRQIAARLAKKRK